MAINGKLMARARERLADIKHENAMELSRRREAVSRAVPEIDTVDASLRGMMREVISSSLLKGEEAKAAIAAAEGRVLELCAQKAELLVEHGYPSDYLDGLYSCRKCRDTGTTDKGEVCDCLKALYEEELAAYLCSLPGKTEDSFKNFDLNYYSGADRELMSMTLETCRSYAASFGADSANLLFRGGTGLGKTFLSGCIARELSSRGHSVCCETAGDAFAAFEDKKFSRDGEVYERAEARVQRIMDCELLILDDLGTEMSTAFTHAALYNIINSRLVAGRKTIVSTNLSQEELQSRYSPQVMSRLMGEYDVVPFRGRDIRAQRKEKRYL